MHGWGGPWKTLTGEEKKLFIDKDYSFALEIDRTPIDLHKVKRYVASEDTMYWMNYVQFPANYFEPGTTYTFHGIWYDPINDLYMDLSVAVTFT